MSVVHAVTVRAQWPRKSPRLTPGRCLDWSTWQRTKAYSVARWARRPEQPSAILLSTPRAWGTRLCHPRSRCTGRSTWTWRTLADRCTPSLRCIPLLDSGKDICKKKMINQHKLHKTWFSFILCLVKWIKTREYSTKGNTDNVKLSFRKKNAVDAIRVHYFFFLLDYHLIL